MLDPDEAAAVAAAFAVSDDQVRRDHLISHLLAVLSRTMPDAVVFFGGTALARAHLPRGRLSEDLDLFAVPRRSDVVAELERVLEMGVRREYGRLSWAPRLRDVRSVDPAVLRTDEGLAVRIQLIDPVGHPAWPTERRALFQRYTDVAPAVLTVPTLSAFAASRPPPGMTDTPHGTSTTCGAWLASTLLTLKQRLSLPDLAQPVTLPSHGCSRIHRRAPSGPLSSMDRQGSWSTPSRP